MDYYFFIITIIDVFVLGIMCILTKYSEVLDIRQRRWFIRSFLLFLAISFPFKTIFYVDHNNQYIRGDFFAIYLVAYFSGILYLLIMTHRVMMKYQNKSKRTIYPIAAFLLACTMIQVSFSHIHISWLCVSF